MPLRRRGSMDDKHAVDALSRRVREIYATVSGLSNRDRICPIASIWFVVRTVECIARHRNRAVADLVSSCPRVLVSSCPRVPLVCAPIALQAAADGAIRTRHTSPVHFAQRFDRLFQFIAPRGRSSWGFAIFRTQSQEGDLRAKPAAARRICLAGNGAPVVIERSEQFLCVLFLSALENSDLTRSGRRCPQTGDDFVSLLLCGFGDSVSRSSNLCGRRLDVVRNSERRRLEQTRDFVTSLQADSGEQDYSSAPQHHPAVDADEASASRYGAARSTQCTHRRPHRTPRPRPRFARGHPRRRGA
jgi:hypothetical protein